MNPRPRRNASRWLVITCLLAAGVSGCLDPRTPRSETLLFGGRIPRGYFFAAGTSQSDQADADCSGDARAAAGLANVNLVGDIRVLAPEAEEIQPPKALPFGAVLESAVAEISGPKGTVLTAGVMTAQVRDTKTGGQLGGFVVTYKGHAVKPEALAQLRRDMERGFRRRYPDERFELLDTKAIVESLTPGKSFGAVVAAVVFADTIHPEVRPEKKFLTLREAINQ